MHKSSRVNYVLSYVDYYEDSYTGTRSKKVIKDVLYYFFLAVITRIFSTSYIFVLPYNLGSLYLKAKTNKPIVIDHRIRAEGKHRLLKNLHSYGWVYEMYWSKRDRHWNNKKYYEFKKAAGGYINVDGQKVNYYFKLVKDRANKGRI